MKPSKYDTSAKVKVGEKVDALIIRENGSKKRFHSYKKSFWGRIRAWL